jgi:hypothetical protein
MSASLSKDGTNPEQLVYDEKSLAILHASKSLEGNFPPSIRNTRLYLLFFSIELQFKKILLSHGVPGKDLRNRDKFGHNLRRLYEKLLEYRTTSKIDSIMNLFIKYEKQYANDLRYYAGLQDIFAAEISDDEFLELETFRESLTRVPKLA